MFGASVSGMLRPLIMKYRGWYDDQSGVSPRSTARWMSGSISLSTNRYSWSGLNVADVPAFVAWWGWSLGRTTNAPNRPICTCLLTSVPEAYRYVPGDPAVNEYVIEPTFTPASASGGAAACTSEVRACWASNCGCAGLPLAVTPLWPWNTIETGSVRVLCRTTVTTSPDVTHRVGPGSWKP